MRKNTHPPRQSPRTAVNAADDADETSLSETNPDAADSNEMDLNEAKQGTESIRGHRRCGSDASVRPRKNMLLLR